MGQSRAAFGPIEAAAEAASPRTGLRTRRVRWTVAISVVLIAGSFASAAAIQLRLDHARALDQAAHFESVRANELAIDLASTLDRYAAIGAAFADAGETAETSAALSEAGGPALANVAVLDRNGDLLSELKEAPDGFLPLPRATLMRAKAGRTVLASGGTQTIGIAFPANGKIVAMQLDASALMPQASMEGAIIASNQGRVLAAGSQWRTLPPPDVLHADGANIATRMVDEANGQRLVAVKAVPNWPVTVGASIATGEALSAWYGALPLYFFIIFGPAIAGAGLAVVFVQEFERRARVAQKVRALRSTRPAEARLLIRLADAERRAVESQRSKAEFIAHMSHELRTPLNAIIGFSEVIEKGFFGDPGHPKYVEYARDISTAGRGLHAKIGDILEFANVEAGRYPLEPAIVDVAAVARETLDELANRAFSRRIRLTVSLPEAAYARADRTAVKRILTVLIDNAFHYTPEKSAVRVQVRTDDGAIVASVQDSGIGFAPDERERAGEAFVRFDRAGRETGTGLGLAVAMALARRMGGAVQLDGRHGEGTCANLRLPRV